MLRGVFNYWVLKRRRQFGRPLLRHFTLRPPAKPASAPPLDDAGLVCLVCVFNFYLFLSYQ
jgi:hypothetical protein